MDMTGLSQESSMAGIRFAMLWYSDFTCLKVTHFLKCKSGVGYAASARGCLIYSPYSRSREG